MGISPSSTGYFAIVKNRLHAEKSSFHMPLEDAEFVPEYFPYNFTSRLAKNNLVLPVYTVFTKNGMQKAFQKLNHLQEADHDYYITASAILELAANAHKLFKISEAHEKRELIRLSLQNLVLNGEKLEYTIQPPFSIILKHVENEEVLRLLGLFRNFKIEINIPLNILQNLLGKVFSLKTPKPILNIVLS